MKMYKGMSYKLNNVAPSQLFAMLVVFFGLLSRPNNFAECRALERVPKISGDDDISGIGTSRGYSSAPTPDIARRASSGDGKRLTLMVKNNNCVKSLSRLTEYYSRRRNESKATTQHIAPNITTTYEELISAAA